jgi:hypothetical protein
MEGLQEMYGIQLTYFGVLICKEKKIITNCDIFDFQIIQFRITGRINKNIRRITSQSIRPHKQKTNVKVDIITHKHKYCHPPERSNL